MEGIPDGPVLAAAFARALGFAAVLPLPEQAAGIGARLGGTLLFTAVLALEAPSAAAATTPVALAAGFLIGAAGALPLALLLSAAGMWAELFETGRGQSLGAMYDPIASVQQALLPIALNQVLYLLLLGEGALSSSAGLLVESMRVIPTATVSVVEFTSIARGLIMVTVAAGAQALVLVLPVTTLFLLIDYCVGLIGRGAQGIALTSEAFQAKMVCGLLFLVALARSGWLPHPAVLIRL